MKGLAICHKGVEDITLNEIKELIDEEGISRRQEASAHRNC